MTTLYEKITGEWERLGSNYHPQSQPFEGMHPIEEIEYLGLGDLCDYTERLAKHCKALQAAWEDEGEDTRKDLAAHNSHLGVVAKLLAQRARTEC